MIEPETRRFLANVIVSISVGLIWMIINMTAGLFAGWMFFHDKPRLGNYIYYVWFILSLAFLLRFLYRTWNRKYPHG